MSEKVIKLGEKEVKLQANAFTVLTYEDNFKGRIFLKDIEEFANASSSGRVPLGLTLKFLWAEAKTADDKIPNLEEFAKQFNIKSIIANATEVLDLIYEDLQTTEVKNQTAAEG